MKRFGYLVVIAVAIASFGTARAQSPTQQFGFGFTAGQALGGHVAYAISPAIHVGTGVGLQIESDNNVFYFAPYFKFLMSGTKELKPYLMANFMVQSVPTTSGESSTMTGLNFGAGGEYFITPAFGLYGGLNVLSLGFDPSRTLIGLLSPYVGIEWFMD